MRNLTQLTILLSLISPAAGFGQQVRGGAVFIKTGYNYTSGMREVFESATASENVKFGDRFVFVGGEVSYRRNSAIYMLDASMGARSDEHIASTILQPFSGFALFKYGFVVYETRKIFVYPTIGGGCSLLFLTSVDKEDNVSINQQTWSLVSPGAEVGLHIDFMAGNVSTDPEIRSGGLIGLRVGARLTAVQQDWYRQKASMKNHQTGNLVGFSVSVVVGLGEYKNLKH